MNKEFIKKQIGEQAYEALCTEAKKYAPKTGKYVEGEKDFNSEVPHDISWDIWDSGLSQYDKLKLVLEIYEEMPCYTFLMYIKHEYIDFTPEVYKYLIDKFINYLSQEDEVLAKPVSYSLWCDFFEDPETVKDIWFDLTSDITKEKLIQRILIASGPVPYELKSKLYIRLIKINKWHYFIFRSLLHSNFDVCGSIDRFDARQVLSKLIIPSDIEYLNELKAELNKK